YIVFFKKKPKTMSNDEVMGIYMDALVTLASSVVQDQENDHMEAVLAFDDQMRVASIKNFTLNNQLLVPDTAVIASLNDIVTPLQQLPESMRPSTLRVVFSDGGGDVFPEYSN